MSWVKVEQAGSQFLSWGSSQVNHYLTLLLDGSGKLRFYSPLFSVDLRGAASIQGGLHHIAITNNAGALTLYVDGVAEDTGSVDLSTFNPTQSTFGTAFLNNIWQGFYKGNLYELSIWDTALTSVQVNAFKNTSPTVSEANLVALYDFFPAGAVAGGDNTALTTLPDLKNAYPGTLFGFPLTGSTGNYGDDALLTIESVSKNDRFAVYPNPTNHIININKIKALEVKSITVYTPLGQVVKEFDFFNNQIDFSTISSGTYFIAINSDKGRDLIKVIKK